VRRLLATLVILAIGIPLMLWAVNNALMSLSRYGAKVRPIVELDAGIVAGAVLLTALLAVAAVTVAALVRSRRLLGAIPLSELRRHALVFGPTGSGKTTIALRAVKLAVDRGYRDDSHRLEGRVLPEDQGCDDNSEDTERLGCPGWVGPGEGAGRCGADPGDG
jgi:multisubunit Na+/H+ antiporter MnhC subunit